LRTRKGPSAMRLTPMLCARIELARIEWARIELARIELARAICASLGGLVCLAGNVQGQCDEASQGFYLPSLQTLIMMPNVRCPSTISSSPCPPFQPPPGRPEAARPCRVYAHTPLYVYGYMALTLLWAHARG
jgi:hypothetical protein